MKVETTNSIQIYLNKLIDYMQRNNSAHNQVNTILIPNKEYTYLNEDYFCKMMNNNKIKHKNEIDKLIEDDEKELDIEDKIKKYREAMNKRNEERKMQDIIYEENKKKILEEMKLDEEYFQKRGEKMELDFQNKLKNLENKKQMDLEKERIEQNRRIEQIEKKRLEDEKKMQQDINNKNRLYKEIEKKDKEIYRIKMQNIQDKQNLEQKHYEQLKKMSKDLTEENKQNLKMRNELYKIENEKKLLVLEKDKLNKINQMNNEYIQYLNRKNNYMNDYINNNNINFNNFSDNNSYYNNYNNLAYSQPLPSNFN